ncbi:MAG: glyoxalase [Spirochaetia bacterium]|nr:glyoxalase [Spirochaetia bacterium]
MDSDSFEILGLDHVQLAIPRGTEAVAREFYAILGWPEVEKPANLKLKGGAWFTCGAHQIHVGVTDDFVAAKKGHPAIMVRGIVAYRKELERRGLKPRDEDPLPGATRFYLDDPFGNRLEFLEWHNHEK